MQRVVVVGSGASGVHFALSLLERGHRVTMIDGGRRGPEPVEPELGLDELKARLPDPSAYFLGADLRGVTLPRDDSEYYGVPPHRGYIFEHVPGFEVRPTGFAPLFSFARGGLAEAWTGGSYPLNDRELAAFPFGEKELLPCYGEVARRIGITGEPDDLAAFMPLHDHLLPPLRLDEHSRRLLAAYERKRDAIQRRLGCHVGRTRVATLSLDRGARKACGYLGRCLWGCPTDSLYVPSLTLRECLAHERFEYLPGLEADRFRVRSGRAVAVVAREIEGGGEREIPVDGALALAAGTLGSARIVLNSVWRHSGEVLRLGGLMDNRQVLVPFVNLGMIGRRFAAESYQYHLLGVAIVSGEDADAADYVHGQVTTLKTALLHPIIQKLPVDLRTATEITRAMHAGLGLVNVNFRDTRREDNHVTLDVDGPGGRPRLVIRYAPDGDEPRRMRAALGRLKRLLWKLGCIVPPGMAHVRPMGASVHYAGVLPMSERRGPWTTDAHGRSHDFHNLFLVDGSTFPFLPAKNLTFTLMANAVRIARAAF